MTTFRRLFGLLAGHRRWIALGALLGFLAVGSNVALMAMSAYLISQAAIVTNVAEIALAITGGPRPGHLAGPTFRYLERYVTHRATFAILADLRVWFFASIEPLAPARLTTDGAATCWPASSPTSRRSRTSRSGSSSRRVVAARDRLRQRCSSGRSIRCWAWRCSSSWS